MENGKSMNIGEAAKASGVSAKMIRHYERGGLIPPAGRNPAGYRIYTEADVHRLRFIRRARDLGFSIAEIHDLLGLWSNRKRRSADVKRVAIAHMADLNQRIAAMRQMVEALEKLSACCAGDDRPECPILADLEGAASSCRLPVGAMTTHRRRRT